MDPDFWHQKWAQGNLGFHESQVNPRLLAHFDKLNLKRGERIFLPLCGKTLDIAWLLAQGYRVVGVELSAIAINELFKNLGLEPEITTVAALAHYRAENIDIWVGNIFDLSAQQLGPVNGVYDRAALVALPAELRRQYSAHVIHLTNRAPQLLIAYEYDQLQMAGPPFSVDADEIKQLFGAIYHLKSLERRRMENRFKGQVAAIEAVWLLQQIS